jgi:hypothetical protein
MYRNYFKFIFHITRVFSSWPFCVHLSKISHSWNVLAGKPPSLFLATTSYFRIVGSKSKIDDSEIGDT